MLFEVHKLIILATLTSVVAIVCVHVVVVVVVVVVLAVNYSHSWLQAQTILRISDYVKKHPKASEAQLKAEVEKEIKKFAEEVAKL